MKIPTANEMIDKARAKYPEERFAVSKSGGSIAVWRSERWECVSMLICGRGWAQCSSNIVPQRDWVESMGPIEATARAGGPGFDGGDGIG